MLALSSKLISMLERCRFGNIVKYEDIYKIFLIGSLAGVIALMIMAIISEGLSMIVKVAGVLWRRSWTLLLLCCSCSLVRIYRHNGIDSAFFI